MTPLRITTVALFLVVLTASGAPQSNAKIDKLFARWNFPESPGAAVVVVKDGEVVFLHGYGSANLDHHIPITPQTRFDVASVAKQFTGLAIAMQMEQGKLTLEDDIHKYVSDLPNFGKPITIAHLLHHTSGLRDWPETLQLSGLDLQGPITLGTVLEMVRRQRELDFAPGEEFLYSNTGYNLLAVTVASIGGKSFREWTEANLFQPLEMKQTRVCDNPAELVPELAESYMRVGGKEKYRRVVSQLAAQGSSSLFISAEDMGKWLLNFETGKVGGPAAFVRMQQRGKLNNGEKVNYGFGEGLSVKRGINVISHGGSWAGYRSVTMRIPEQHFAVAILANTADMNPDDLAQKIAALYVEFPADAKADKKPAAIKGEPATWKPFEGTYRLGPNWLLTITLEGEKLITQATHESKFEMTPTGTNRFWIEGYTQPLEFIRQPSGEVTNLIYRGINAPKVMVAKPTSPDLGAYVGDYWSDELRVAARIEIHDGKLAVRQRSGDWMHVVPGGGERFDAEGGGYSVEFVRGSNSEITEAKLSGGRVRNIRYRRATLPSP